MDNKSHQISKGFVGFMAPLGRGFAQGNRLLPTLIFSFFMFLLPLNTLAVGEPLPGGGGSPPGIPPEEPGEDPEIPPQAPEGPLSEVQYEMSTLVEGLLGFTRHEVQSDLASEQAGNYHFYLGSPHNPFHGHIDGTQAGKSNALIPNWYWQGDALWEKSNAAHEVLLHENTYAGVENFNLEVEIRALKGLSDGTGIVWNYEDPNNYDILRWDNPARWYSGNYRDFRFADVNSFLYLERIEDGEITVLDTYEVTEEDPWERWHHFRIEARAGMVTILKDAEEIMVGEFSSTSPVGEFGLYTVDNDGGVGFQNFLLEELGTIEDEPEDFLRVIYGDQSEEAEDEHEAWDVNTETRGVYSPWGGGVEFEVDDIEEAGEYDFALDLRNNAQHAGFTPQWWPFPRDNWTLPPSFEEWHIDVYVNGEFSQTLYAPASDAMEGATVNFKAMLEEGDNDIEFVWTNESGSYNFIMRWDANIEYMKMTITKEGVPTEPVQDEMVHHDPGTRNYGPYQVVEHSDDFLLDEGTVSFWFRDEGSLERQGLWSKDSNDYDTGGHLTLRIGENRKLQYRLQSTSESYKITSSTTISLNTWNHVAATFGPGGMELYLNGTRIGTESYEGGLGTTSGGIGNYEPIVLGGNSWSSGDLVATPVRYPFSGKMANVALHNKKLTASQIAALYADAP